MSQPVPVGAVAEAQRIERRSRAIAAALRQMQERS
jgi:hypothetical protein